MDFAFHLVLEFTGGTYILCEVCQEQHVGSSGGMGLPQGESVEGQDRLRDLTTVLAPDLAPAPLATMEGMVALKL